MRGCHSPGTDRITAPGFELAAIDVQETFNSDRLFPLARPPESPGLPPPGFSI